MTSNDEDNVPSDELGFAKARYEYCLQIYEREQARREGLERKSQLYLSLISVFLGALVFNLDFINEIKIILNAQSSQVVLIKAIYVGSICLAVSLLISLIGVLFTINIKSYSLEYPANISLRLFSPSGDYLNEYNEKGFYRAVAMTYASALEEDMYINNNKARSLTVALIGLLFATVACAVVLGLIAYLQLV